MDTYGVTSSQTHTLNLPYLAVLNQGQALLNLGPNLVELSAKHRQGPEGSAAIPQSL